MCVIAIAEKRRPKMPELRAMAEANPDGIGAAILHRDVVRYVKGLTLDDAHKLSREAPLPYVLHFRFATVGAPDDPRLCHPFPTRRHDAEPLAGVADEVVFHNGTWQDWKSGLSVVETDHGGCGAGPVSDSRVIARLVAKFGAKATASIVGGRLAVFRAERPHIITAGGPFVDVKGLLVSNTRWIIERKLERRAMSQFETSTSTSIRTASTVPLSAAMPVVTSESPRAAAWLVTSSSQDGREITTRVGRRTIEGTLVDLAERLLDGSITDVRVRQTVV